MVQIVVVARYICGQQFGGLQTDPLDNLEVLLVGLQRILVLQAGGVVRCRG